MIHYFVFTYCVIRLQLIITWHQSLLSVYAYSHGFWRTMPYDVVQLCVILMCTTVRQIDVYVPLLRQMTDDIVRRFSLCEWALSHLPKFCVLYAVLFCSVTSCIDDCWTITERCLNCSVPYFTVYPNIEVVHGFYRWTGLVGLHFVCVYFLI